MGSASTIEVIVGICLIIGGLIVSIVYGSIEIDSHIHYISFEEATCQTDSSNSSVSVSFDVKSSALAYANVNTFATLDDGVVLPVRVHYPPGWPVSEKKVRQFVTDFTALATSPCIVSRAINNYKGSGRHEAVFRQILLTGPICAVLIPGLVFLCCCSCIAWGCWASKKEDEEIRRRYGRGGTLVRQLTTRLVPQSSSRTPHEEGTYSDEGQELAENNPTLAPDDEGITVQLAAEGQ